ncbi:MAG TPA: PucR family transcriptional regulator ligand-binding domain-containing protein [Candidatus Limnocylindrales bacterium]|nr:PucR family transcriptional regulator ligand-binding domain-containing protein [Candidatus Limnocylindrales bacterium]
MESSLPLSVDRAGRTGVPVSAVLDLAALADARLVAGRTGLDRIVGSVNVMEVPDILQWVKPGELLVTTAYPLREDPVALEQLVPDLVASGLSGLAIKPARYIPSIPARMIEDADRLGFPLIELPPSASFNEIIGAILGVILDVQSVRLQRAADIHDRFTKIVLSGGGLRHIAEALADSIAMPVAILDGHGGVLAHSAGLDDAQVGVVLASNLDAGGDGALGSVTLADGRPAVARPIVAGPDRHGSIVALGQVTRLGADELEALDYAATVAALRLVQARAVAESDRRFQAVCLEELVTGHVTDRDALMERAMAFDWDLSVPRCVLVAEYQTLDGRPFGQLAGSAGELAARHRLFEAARFGLGHGAIIWERTAGVAALIAATGHGRGPIRSAGQDVLAEALRRSPGSVVDIGIGRITPDPLRLDESFREARSAIAVAGWSRGHGAVSLFEDMQLDRLLFDTPQAERATFIEDTIGALLAYDARHRTNLVETLEIYLATRRVAVAARRLYVHANTLTNRLERIADIVGPFVDDADRCLTLGLAIRLRRSLGRGPAAH